MIATERQLEIYQRYLDKQVELREALRERLAGTEDASTRDRLKEQLILKSAAIEHIRRWIRRVEQSADAGGG